jgi:hypothetical protein
MKDERLEMLSDMVRKGEPIGFGEALEVIEYQQMLQKERESKKSWFTKMIEKLKL